MNSSSTAAWLTSWLQQCVLRRAPQDDPFSPAGLVGGLLAYALVDVLQARAASGWPVALGMSLVDTLIVILFSWLVLLVAKKPARLAQTLTAVAGTGAVLGLPGIPLMMHAARAQQNGEPGAALVLGWLVLLVWNISVQAHIFRHALSSRYGVGLLVAGLHTVVAIVVLDFLFPPTVG